MKAIFITNTISEYRRGLQVVVFDQAQLLLEKGWQVCVFGKGDYEQRYFDAGIEVITYRHDLVRSTIGKGISNRRECVQTWKKFIKDDFDIICAHDYISFFTILPHLKKEVKKTFIVHDPLVYHDKMMKKQSIIRRMVLSYIEKSVYKKSDIVGYISDYTMKRFIYLDERLKKKTRLVYDWVDTDKYTLPENKEKLRQESQISDKFTVFTARPLEQRTGIINLVRGFEKFSKDKDNVELRIAGKGVQYEEIQNTIEELKCNNIKMLGYVSDDELVEWYQKANLVVIPSVDGEGFGLPIIEAMACGTPVLGTPVCAIPEVLNGLPERLFSGIDSDSICNGIERFYSDWMKSGDLDLDTERRYVLERYSKSSAGERYWEVMSSL